jgi:hypothetical protein
MNYILPITLLMFAIIVTIFIIKQLLNIENKAMKNMGLGNDIINKGLIKNRLINKIGIYDNCKENAEQMDDNELEPMDDKLEKETTIPIFKMNPIDEEINDDLNKNVESYDMFNLTNAELYKSKTDNIIIDDY